MSLFNSKKKKTKAPYVVMIAREEWGEAEQECVVNFTSAPIFAKLRAVFDGYLIKHILQGKSEDFRLGWQTCMQQMQAFKRPDEIAGDSNEVTTMQVDDFK